MYDYVAYDDQLYMDNDYVSDCVDSQASVDAEKLMKCILVFMASAVFAAIVYLFTGNKLVAVAICGFFVFILSMINTTFALFVLYMMLALDNAVRLHPSFTVSKVMGIVVLISFLTHLYRYKLIFPNSLKYLYLFMVWAFVSLLWSRLPLFGFITWVSIVLNLGMMFILVSVVRDEKTLFLVISGFIFGAFATSMMVVTGSVVQKTGAAAELGRVALSEETNAISLASSIVVGFLVVVYSFFREGRYKKIGGILVLLLFFVTLVKTQSRMPLAVAFCVPVVSLIICASKGKRSKYLFGSMLLAITLVSISMIMWYSSMISDKAKDRVFSDTFSTSGRLYMWGRGFDLFMQRPFHGWGLHHFPVEVSGGIGVSSAHNNAIAILVELGIVGMVLSVAIYVGVISQAVRIKKPSLRWLAIAMILYTLLTGFTVTTYIKKHFWYALSIAITAVNIAGVGKKEDYLLEDIYYNNNENIDYDIDN